MLAERNSIEHGIFPRKYTGGRSLNVSLDPKNKRGPAEENQRVIAGCFGRNRLVFVNQVHGTKVVTLEKGIKETELTDYDEPLIGDAIITNIAGKPLAIQTGDCQAIIMYDPAEKVIANVHSGWRGSVGNIVAITIKKMAEKFDCKPWNILTGIGPSLGQCCAEFVNYKTELPETFRKYKNDKDCFDFWSITRAQLLSSGVLDHHIAFSNICTSCCSDRFFSYRKEHGSERFASVISLKQTD